MPSKNVDINLPYYVLVRCDIHLKLEGVTVEQSDRAAMAFSPLPPPVLWKSTCTTKDV